MAVAPLVGAWIEIFGKSCDVSSQIVAPLVGAWIEIKAITRMSVTIPVAPLVGAWIEIFRLDCLYRLGLVAPLVGAWIEIVVPVYMVRALIERENEYVEKKKF